MALAVTRLDVFLLQDQWGVSAQSEVSRWLAAAQTTDTVAVLLVAVPTRREMPHAPARSELAA